MGSKGIINVYVEGEGYFFLNIIPVIPFEKLNVTWTVQD